ncbi:MAG: lipid-A-disaccharide synthase N-terminal domain-containing protein [Acidobacteria bacterium]|nr:lipid-A-disaccharide synthase N-terminal domain-containing protein [Acidobacteriota bacterium]
MKLNSLSFFTPQKLWIAFGIFGQLLFFMRFFVQWLASEKAKKSVVPVSFWYFSIGGAVILLIYAIYRLDPVFILGQATGLLIYIRNLMLIRKFESGTD